MTQVQQAAQQASQEAQAMDTPQKQQKNFYYVHYLVCPKPRMESLIRFNTIAELKAWKEEHDVEVIEIIIGRPRPFKTRLIF